MYYVGLISHQRQLEALNYGGHLVERLLPEDWNQRFVFGMHCKALEAQQVSREFIQSPGDPRASFSMTGYPSSLVPHYFLITLVMYWLLQPNAVFFPPGSVSSLLWALRLRHLWTQWSSFSHRMALAPSELILQSLECLLLRCLPDPLSVLLQQVSQKFA